MEYKTHKRTKNLTLRDIHVGDWVQVWSELTERYSPPLKITQICDDGTIYLIISEEQRLDPWEENIKDIDALPIDADLLRGFGYEVNPINNVKHDVLYQGVWIGYLWNRGYEVLFTDIGNYTYVHELGDDLKIFPIDIKLEWKGIEK